MTAVSANDLTTTHYCKFPGCENEVNSPVGRYSYCKEHQGKAVAKPATSAAKNGANSGTAQALRDLIALATGVDKAKTKADVLQRKANEAGKEADLLEAQYRDALAAAARGAA